MTGKNTTTRVFKLPKNCEHFPSEKIIAALENFLFYPSENKYISDGMDNTWVQKRFVICEEAQSLINHIKNHHKIDSDKKVITMAILHFQL